MAGRPADGGERLRIVTGLTLKGIMPACGAHEGAKEHQAIGDTGDLWKKLGDLKSVELGWDGSEGTANLGRGIRLGVDEIHLGRAAVEMKVDYSLVGRTNPSGGLGAKKVGQVETTYAECPDTQETTSVEPEASSESDHERTSPTS